jgi:hypothetical protein
MSANPSPLLYAAESWEKVYKAFDEINFTAYDYDAVKQSLIDYLKLNYPENFNDYHEASLMIALAEMFAYIAEQISYRVDMSVHEVLLPSAQRKQSILALAKLISYTASRNLPLRGLVKITSISTSEEVRDSQGNTLTNRVIRWNDANNSLWKEQFLAVINKVMTQPFGSPYKSFQIDDTIFQQYEFMNVLETEVDRATFRNGVLRFKSAINGIDLDFELVPADIDASGVFERSPNPNAYFTFLYGDDGYGDNSDTTGFMMYLKQGTLSKLNYTFDSALPNRSLNVEIPNVNDVDVWVQQIDAQGVITTEWEAVPNVAGQNLAFNGVKNTTKYEIETLEDDKIRIIFGDGDFAQIPTGSFNIWVRSSASGSVQMPKNQISEKAVTFLYTSKLGKQESCTVTYSLTAALQNSAQSEDIEHIRSVAPSVYYTQNRMVNGQDYNSFFLKDPSILRLKSVNRTFAGQPKYIEWNDASGSYQNVKVFGNDLRMYYNVGVATQVSSISSRSMIDEVLEPALSNTGISNLLTYAFYTSPSPLNLAFINPRTRFIEDANQLINGFPLQEKTLIQGVLDRHWYGEPDAIASLDVNLSETSGLPKTPHAIVNNDTDQLVYDENIKLVTKNYVTGIYTAVPTPGNISGIQEAVIRQKRFGIRFNPDRPFTSALRINSSTVPANAITSSDVLTSADIVQGSAKEEVYTVEIIDTAGTFTVYGSLSGPQVAGTIGEVYTNGVISFIIGFPPAASTTVTVGDAFIIDVKKVSNVFTPYVYKKNLTGSFEIIDESILTANAETLPYDVGDEVKSWVMIIERFDNEDTGEISYWKITQRNFELTVESPTTKFWFNQDLKIVDPTTKKPVYDQVRILKSNLTADGTQAVGTDQIYTVSAPVLYPDGTVNFNALAVAPITTQSVYYSGSGTANNPLEFLRFIGENDYVYFYKEPATGKLTPVTSTVYLQSLDYVNDVSGNYVRKLGRENLDFLWQHFTPDEHLIDPSTSNIIDCYVLTRGYYAGVQNYLRGIEPVEPAPPSSLELRNTYRTLIENKMISDTVVMHSGKVKLIFGSQAVPELRATFRIVRARGAKLTGDQIRSKVLDLINQYFSINNWDFGQDFYATELMAVIQSKLPTEIASAVLVPVFPTNYFGDLFYLRSAPDEVFVSCAALGDIEIIDGIDRLTLKQKQ